MKDCLNNSNTEQIKDVGQITENGTGKCLIQRRRWLRKQIERKITDENY